MNFMKRAWKSTKVKWGRSLLLFAVFTAILIFVLAGLTIRSAAEEAALRIVRPASTKRSWSNSDFKCQSRSFI